MLTTDTDETNLTVPVELDHEALTLHGVPDTIVRNRYVRCDGCGVRAYYAVSLGDRLKFMLCGHHKNQHEATLFGGGYVVESIDDNNPCEKPIGHHEDIYSLD